jgi:hypothetical protein
LEIRFEGQRRIGDFEAIRSASLLRKSIVENGQRASTAAGLPSPIQVVCQRSNSGYIFYIQCVADISSQQICCAHALQGGISPRIELQISLPTN